MNAHGLPLGVEHEQPDDRARRTSHRSGKIEDQPKRDADPALEAVHHQREEHDEDGLAGEPDPLELRDVFECRRELEEVERVDEVREADTPRRAQRERDRINSRRDAESEEQDNVDGDKAVARRPRGAGG